MLKVLKAGLFTTVQDKGRYGYLNKGVPVAGYMDQFSAAKVNSLLGNSKNAAVIEITMTGPKMKFEAPTFICLGGAEISAKLNEQPISNYSLVKVTKGDILTYGKLQNGFRAYLGVRNGFETPVVLGSRSYFTGITKQNHVSDGDIIPYSEDNGFQPKIMEMKVNSTFDQTVLGVTPGPEYEMLSDKQLEHLFSRGFSISNENNRMAYQLEEMIPGHEISMLTSATLPGTVQFTPSGKLIVLMKDGQTTGGYPRILQLSDDAINILSQKKFGDKVKFKLVKE